MRIVIVGAGVIGLFCAWRLATHAKGAVVTLVDPDPQRGAGMIAAGMLAPASEAHLAEPKLLALGRASARLWPGVAAELSAVTGKGTGYRHDGAMVVAYDADDRRSLEEFAARLELLSLSAERLSASACRELEPGLCPEIRGGLLIPGDGSVDNRALLAALRHACRLVDVRVEKAAIDRVLDEGGAVRGVRTRAGDIVSADVVVIAAGCWSASLHPSLADSIRPVRGEILRLKPRADGVLAPRRTLRGLIEGRPIYLVPRDDGELVVGATEEEDGEDTLATAGGVGRLLGDALRIFPAAQSYALVEASAGLRPVSRDGLPLIAAMDARGLIVASGHGRNGFLLAPITADMVTALVTGEAPAMEESA